MERPDPGARNRRLLSRLRIAFVLLVGASAGLIAAYAGGSPFEALIAIGSGAVVGAVLVWFAFPSPSEGESGGSLRGR
ncbi:MAG: membrane protein YdbS with pleckstrin-like domain [Natronomonas sp.]|jgi:membrane protein YdbS with pleckstrin-like domain